MKHEILKDNKLYYKGLIEVLLHLEHTEENSYFLLTLAIDCIKLCMRRDDFTPEEIEDLRHYSGKMMDIWANETFTKFMTIGELKGTVDPDLINLTLKNWPATYKISDSEFIVTTSPTDESKWILIGNPSGGMKDDGQFLNKKFDTRDKALEYYIKYLK